MAQLDLTNIAASGIPTPSSGVLSLYSELTGPPAKRLSTKDDAGAIVTLIGATTVDTGAGRLKNKDLEDLTTFIVDDADATKKLTFSVGGNTTGITLTVSSAQTTAQTLSIPNIAGASIVITDTLAQSITGVKTMTGMTTLAGTTAVASFVQQGGTNLTTAAVGAHENDSICMYQTTNTTDGRARIPACQHFRLTANGSSITTIANVFGTTSNISLVASAFYYIEIVMFFLKSATTDALTITLTNSVAPTSQNIYWEMSPITGVVAPPGTATMLEGMIQNDATAVRTIVTGTLTLSVNHYIRIRIELTNGTGTSLKIQATNATGVTPLRGSFWTATRIPTGNTGTFAA